MSVERLLGPVDRRLAEDVRREVLNATLPGNRPFTIRVSIDHAPTAAEECLDGVTYCEKCSVAWRGKNPDRAVYHSHPCQVKPLEAPTGTPK